MLEPLSQPDRELWDDCELIPAERVQLVEVVPEQAPDAVPHCVLQCLPYLFVHFPELPLDW